MSKWLNWKPRERKTAKHKAIFLTPIPQKNKKQKTKPTSASSSDAFATLRKVYTVGITPQEFLSATSPKGEHLFWT